MNFDLPTLLGASAGAVTAIGGVWTSIRHIRYGIQAKKDRERQEILDRANEEMAKTEVRIEEKIRQLRSDFETHKDNIIKDLDYLKESQANEMKNLSTKVELLREELREGHANMISLLTSLINKS